MSNGDYNSVMHASGWSNLEMLTRRYGRHSFSNDREKMAEKMDMFLDGKLEGLDTDNTQKVLISSIIF